MGFAFSRCGEVPAVLGAPGDLLTCQVQVPHGPSVQTQTHTEGRGFSFLCGGGTGGSAGSQSKLGSQVLSRDRWTCCWVQAWFYWTPFVLPPAHRGAHPLRTRTSPPAGWRKRRLRRDWPAGYDIIWSCSGTKYHMTSWAPPCHVIFGPITGGIAVKSFYCMSKYLKRKNTFVQNI